MVKSPRVYIRDSGFLHALLQIKSIEQLYGHPAIGKNWEGFVIESIFSVLPAYTPFSFYRSAAGAEIDFLIEKQPGEYWAVEIKMSRQPKVKKGFDVVCEDLAVKRRFVIYPGEASFSLEHDILVLPLTHFLQQVQVD